MIDLEMQYGGKVEFFSCEEKLPPFNVKVIGKLFDPKGKNMIPKNDIEDVFFNPSSGWALASKPNVVIHVKEWSLLPNKLASAEEIILNNKKVIASLERKVTLLKNEAVAYKNHICNMENDHNIKIQGRDKKYTELNNLANVIQGDIKGIINKSEPLLDKTLLVAIKYVESVLSHPGLMEVDIELFKKVQLLLRENINYVEDFNVYFKQILRTLNRRTMAN